MKTLMIAAATLLSLSAGVANANEGGPVANTQFTENPSYLAQVPVQAPSVATAQGNGQAVHVYSMQSNHGTRLFAPYEGNG